MERERTVRRKEQRLRYLRELREWEEWLDNEEEMVGHIHIPIILIPKSNA